MADVNVFRAKLDFNVIQNGFVGRVSNAACTYSFYITIFMLPIDDIEKFYSDVFQESKALAQQILEIRKYFDLSDFNLKGYS